METSKGLFLKKLLDGTQLYRDYRKKENTSYAYYNNKLVPIEKFKEFRALEKIELKMAGSLYAYG